MTCPYCKNESDEIIDEVYHEKTDVYTMSLKCGCCGKTWKHDWSGYYHGPDSKLKKSQSLHPSTNEVE